MNRKASVILALVLVVAVLAVPSPARAQRDFAQTVRRILDQGEEATAVCVGGTQASGAEYQICIPLLLPLWNGELLIYAHGYVSPEEPVAIPSEFSDLSLFANLLGYGTATTSYSVNGLAVLPGKEDLYDLVDVFKGIFGSPERIYLVGPSLGGLITTLRLKKTAGILSVAWRCAPRTGIFVPRLIMSAISGWFLIISSLD